VESCDLQNYIQGQQHAVEVTIPKLNEMAYEQVELAGVPFTDYIANKHDQRPTGEQLRCAARVCPHLVRHICDEYDRAASSGVSPIAAAAA